MRLVAFGKAEKPVPISNYMLHDDYYSYMKLASASANFDRISLGFCIKVESEPSEKSRTALYIGEFSDPPLGRIGSLVRIATGD